MTTYIYIGGDYFAQATSEYIGGTVVEVIKEPTEAMDEGIKKVLYLIGVMVIAFLSGLMFHSETIGKTIFMAGGVISPLVSLDFVWLCGTCVIYYAMIMAKGVYSRD